MSGLTYREAGVDIEAGDRLVDRIRPLAARTRTPHVLGGVGGFAGLCDLPSDIEDPILVSGTDGVGTKLKLAFDSGIHDTVGIDLVAMCVNDVITTGARPLFFLDYFATGNLDVDTAALVIEGIAKGCEQAGCALLGGETAELPGFYGPGEYDLAGFAVGVVGRKKVIDGAAIQAGDVVLGLASSGLHSNGFSLARKVFEGRPLSEPAGFESGTLAEALLRPTRIYVRATEAALAVGGVHGLCHITGGGLPLNLPRILPEGVMLELDETRWPRPPVFDAIAELGGVEPSEMYRTFNMGVGFVLVVDPARAEAVSEVLAAAGEEVWTIGSVLPREGDERVHIRRSR